MSKSGRALEWLTGWATSALRDFWRILTAALIALIIVYALRLWAIGSMGGALPMESLSMGYYNEADTWAKLIDPKIKLVGWGEGQIEREHYFVKGRAVTDGRIYLVGEASRRREPHRVDYLLRYNGQMIAVLEAKDERHTSDAGLEQAKTYARLLDVPFAYSSNGHAFVEFDLLENKSRELGSFPAPNTDRVRYLF